MQVPFAHKENGHFFNDSMMFNLAAPTNAPLQW
jgi:hypothetical protein